MELNDSAYTLRLPTEVSKGFKKGHIPWNRGLSWEQQGISQEERERRIASLQAKRNNRTYSHEPTASKPVIQMDEYGDRLHWYISSEAAARKIGCAGRNIRKVCDGERKHAGGYRWKWDERFC